MSKIPKYNRYVKWFESHFNFHPTDNDFKFTNPINEMIHIRIDIQMYLNTKASFEREKMEKRLNHLKVITFDEYKTNMI